MNVKTLLVLLLSWFAARFAPADDRIFVTDDTTSGVEVRRILTSASNPNGIVAIAPEPSSWAMLALGAWGCGPSAANA